MQGSAIEKLRATDKQLEASEVLDFIKRGMNKLNRMFN